MSIMVKDERRWKAIEFRDWSEFLDYAETPLSEEFRQKYRGDSCKSFGVGNMNFHDTNTFDDAKVLARGGWEFGIQRMREVRGRLEHLVRAAQTEKAQAMRFDLAGEWLDMGRAVTGNPECWGGFSDIGDAKADKVVTIMINVACMADVEEGPLFARGAVCLAAVDLIESIGHRVELRVGSCAENGEGKFEYQVIAKQAGEPLDIDRLTFFLCHKSGARRYGFACYEHLGRTQSGQPVRMIGADERVVYVPEISSSSQWRGQSLEAQVIGLCKQAGIEFEEDVLKNIVTR